MNDEHTWESDPTNYPPPYVAPSRTEPPPQYGGYPPQPYPQQSYPPPSPQPSPQPYPYPYQHPQSTNGLAIASMILGIIWLWWIGSVLAVAFGHVALNQMKSNPRQGGRGMAIAGLVLGYIGVAMFVLFLLASVITRSGTS